MRQRWSQPIAAIALAGGSALAITSTAQASTTAGARHTAMVQPGGLAVHLTRPPAHGKPAAGGATSTNWSGYAVTGGTYNSVSASWIQPTAQCAPGGGNQYSSFWAGLDGEGSKSVEQTGSEADCSNGTPHYYAWYEMFPKYPRNFTDPVQAGDHLTASVTYHPGGRFTLALSDTTQGWTHTVHKRLRSAKRASAEIIIEAPASSTAILPLADFGTVTVTGSSVNGSPIGSLNPAKITMQAGQAPKDSVSDLSNGTDFTTTWLHS